jgi:uncharacterized membrane protein YbjE (DUF340 family)
MLTVIIIMISGIVVGYLIRNQKWIAKKIAGIITWSIYLLLFLLGITVGTDETIMSNLEEIGFVALLLTIGAIAGSVVLSWITYVIYFRKNER